MTKRHLFSPFFHGSSTRQFFFLLRSKKKNIYIYINRVKRLIQRAGRYHFLFSTKKKKEKEQGENDRKRKRKKKQHACDELSRRSIPAIKRGAKSLIDSARSWLPRYEKSLSPPLPSSFRVKFCRVNHNVTSIHPRDRD